MSLDRYRARLTNELELAVMRHAEDEENLSQEAREHSRGYVAGLNRTVQLLHEYEQSEESDQ